MAKQRKLQGEMETTLKKISEGVDEWEELWNKYERSHDMVRPGGGTSGHALHAINSVSLI